MGGEYYAIRDELFATLERLSKESGLTPDQILDEIARQHFERVSPKNEEIKMDTPEQNKGTIRIVMKRAAMTREQQQEFLEDLSRISGVPMEQIESEFRQDTFTP